MKFSNSNVSIPEIKLILILKYVLFYCYYNTTVKTIRYDLITLSIHLILSIKQIFFYITIK